MKVDSKYNGIILTAFLLLFIAIFVVVRSAKTQYYTTIIDAKLTSKNDNQFPDCYLEWNGNKYLITDFYKYKNDDLIEYKSPASLGFAVSDLTDKAVSYNGSRDRHKKLWYKEKSDGLQLDNEKFPIDYRNKDTIVSKINDTIIKLMIQKFVD